MSGRFSGPALNSRSSVDVHSGGLLSKLFVTLFFATHLFYAHPQTPPFSCAEWIDAATVETRLNALETMANTIKRESVRLLDAVEKTMREGEFRVPEIEPTNKESLRIGDPYGQIFLRGV